MGAPFNPDIPGDYAKALGRLEASKSYAPNSPRYPWPNPDNERIKRLEAENAELRKEIVALRRGQGAAPEPAGPGVGAFHATDPIPDSTGGAR